eukprot:scaffold78380_cov61-Phaeocystis_antarctica.AAC.4
MPYFTTTVVRPGALSSAHLMWRSARTSAACSTCCAGWRAPRPVRRAPRASSGDLREVNKVPRPRRCHLPRIPTPSQARHHTRCAFRPVCCLQDLNTQGATSDRGRRPPPPRALELLTAVNGAGGCGDAVEGVAPALLKARIMLRTRWFGMSVLLSSLAPVFGEVSLVRSHSEMASRSRRAPQLPRSPPTARPPRCCRPRRSSLAPTHQPSPPLPRPPHAPWTLPQPVPHASPPPAPVLPPLALPPPPPPPASPCVRHPTAPPAACRAGPAPPRPRRPLAPRVAPQRAPLRAQTAHRLRWPPAAPPPPALQPTRRAWAWRRAAGRARRGAARRSTRRLRLWRGLPSSSFGLLRAGLPLGLLRLLLGQQLLHRRVRPRHLVCLRRLRCHTGPPEADAAAARCRRMRAATAVRPWTLACFSTVRPSSSSNSALALARSRARTHDPCPLEVADIRAVTPSLSCRSGSAECSRRMSKIERLP